MIHVIGDPITSYALLKPSAVYVSLSFGPFTLQGVSLNNAFPIPRIAPSTLIQGSPGGCYRPRENLYHLPARCCYYQSLRLEGSSQY